MKSILIALCTLAIFAACDNKTEDRSEGNGQVQTNQETTPPAITKNVEVEEFDKKLKETPGAQLIDVRTPEEYMDGHIAKAVNLNFYDDLFAQNLERLDKSSPVFVYCKSGGRSSNAMNLMKEKGFSEVYNLQGGITAWGKASKNIVQ
jgi:rhodanese-related sulfurtransferase